MNTKNAKRRDKLRAAGLCEDCGKRPRSPRSKCRCDVCLSRNTKTAGGSTPATVLKQTIVNHYGGKCACPGCSETNIRFLTIDHKKDDGGAIRKADKRMRKPHQLYRWIIKQGYPDDLQVLCFNCNCGRAGNGGICPHLL